VSAADDQEADSATARRRGCRSLFIDVKDQPGRDRIVVAGLKCGHLASLLVPIAVAVDRRRRIPASRARLSE
jgi:hypothetical protein